MGQPKLLLRWKTTTVLGQLIESWRALRAGQIAVVCAPGAEPIVNELNRLHFPTENCIFNPEPDRGMFSSIQCAANWEGWTKELTHWLVTLGDQPHIRQETLQTLLKFGARHSDKVCQPIRNGHYRHPVLFPRRIFVELASSSARTLKDFLLQHENDPAGFESDDSGLDLDMDTPEDYERLRQLYSQR